MHLARASVLLLAQCFSTVAATTAIRNVTVIDGTGAPARPHSTIVFSGANIVALGAAGATVIPKGARVVEGRGKFVIPGLWDMHVHLWGIEDMLPGYVAFGVTGVRDMGSDYTRVRRWRRAVDAGRAVGPHIITCGPPVSGEPSGNPALPVIVVRTPVEARAAFDKLYDMNVDFVSVLSSVPRDAYIALAEQCRHWRVPFAGDLPKDIGLAEAIEQRQASIERIPGEFLAGATGERQIGADKLPRARALGVFNTDLARHIFRQSALFGTRQTPELSWWERKALAGPDPADARKEFAFAEKIVELMKQYRVEILAGTDTGGRHTIPGETLHRELELLVKAGLSPMEAIQSATSAPAQFIGWDKAVGSVKPGMVADLVVLDANPLVNIANIRKISGVAVRGVYLDRIRLNVLLRQSNHRQQSRVRSTHVKSNGETSR